MIQVLVHHQVADYNNWRSVFDSALDRRQNGGEASRHEDGDAFRAYGRHGLTRFSVRSVGLTFLVGVEKTDRLQKVGRLKRFKYGFCLDTPLPALNLTQRATVPIVA